MMINILASLFFHLPVSHQWFPLTKPNQKTIGKEAKKCNLQDQCSAIQSRTEEGKDLKTKKKNYIHRQLFHEGLVHVLPLDSILRTIAIILTICPFYIQS